MARGDRKLEVVISAADEYSAEFRKFENVMKGVPDAASNMARGANTHFEALKGHWLAATAAIAGASAVVIKAWSLAEAYAEFDEQKTALTGLASHYNVTADQLIDAIQRAASGTISSSAAMSVANRGIMMGLNPEQISTFAEASERFADALGVDLAGAFESLVQATATGQERMLRTLGVMVDLDGAQKRYAASIGKTVDQLTQEQRQTINATTVQKALEETIRRMGPAMDSAADEFARFKVQMGGLAKEAGETLLPVMRDLVWVLSQGIKNTKAIIGAFRELGEGIGITAAKLAFGEIIPKQSLAELDMLKDRLESLETQRSKKAIFKGGNFFGFLNKEELSQIDIQIEQTKKRIAELQEYLRKQTVAEAKSAVERRKNAGTTAPVSGVNVRNGPEPFWKHMVELARKEDEIFEDLEKKRQKMREASFEQSTEAEERIRSVNVEAKKINATEEELVNIQVRLFELTGANIEQVTRYREALDALNAKKKKIAEDERDAEARIAGTAALASLNANNPYQTTENMDQFFQGAAMMAKPGGDPRLLALQNYHTQVIQAMVDAGEEQSAINARYQDMMTDYDRAQWSIRMQTAASGLGSMANMMQNIYVATGSHNKAMFTAMKAFSVASTLIKTYEDAVSGRASLSKIPYVGPFLGNAYFAMAIASGMAMVANIRATEPGGSTSISSGGTANPSFSGGSPSAYPVPERLASDSEVRPSQEITINIYNPLSEQNWAKITEDNIIPAINAAGDRNVHVTVRSM